MLLKSWLENLRSWKNRRITRRRRRSRSSVTSAAAIVDVLEPRQMLSGIQVVSHTAVPSFTQLATTSFVTVPGMSATVSVSDSASRYMFHASVVTTGGGANEFGVFVDGVQKYDQTYENWPTGDSNTLINIDTYLSLPVGTHVIDLRFCSQATEPTGSIHNSLICDNVNNTASMDISLIPPIAAGVPAGDLVSSVSMSPTINYFQTSSSLNYTQIPGLSTNVSVSNGLDRYRVTANVVAINYGSLVFGVFVDGSLVTQQRFFNSRNGTIPINFEADLALLQGNHTIDVRALSLYGNSVGVVCNPRNSDSLNVYKFYSGGAEAMQWSTVTANSFGIRPASSGFTVVDGLTTTVTSTGTQNAYLVEASLVVRGINSNDLGRQELAIFVDGQYAFSQVAYLTTNALFPLTVSTPLTLSAGTHTIDIRHRGLASSGTIYIESDVNNTASMTVMKPGPLPPFVVSPVGSPAQVKTTQSKAIYQSSAAIDNAGDFVVGWTNLDSLTSDYVARARISNANGFTSEFGVGSAADLGSSQGTPAVGMDAAGDIVAVWSQTSGGAVNPAGIYGQRFDVWGNRIGSEFQVSTKTAVNLAMAMDQKGDFVVTWSYSATNDINTDIFARSYSSNGSSSSEFEVNQYTLGIQQRPTIAIDNNGDFVIAWESKDQLGAYSPGYDIFAQRYSADGTPLSIPGQAANTEFLVNTVISQDQQYPSVGMDGAGDFVVSWYSAGHFAAQHFDSSGNFLGSEFNVQSDNFFSTASAPSVSMDATGDYVIAWTQSGQSSVAQMYAANGSAVGTEIVIANIFNRYEYFPTVAMNVSGDFIAVWEYGPQINGGFDPNARFFNVVQKYHMQTQPSVNIAPTLVGSSSLDYPNNSGPAIVNPNIVVRDSDSSTLSSAAISILNYVPGQESLQFTDTSEITSSFDSVNGVLNLVASTNGAPISSWQAALRSVTYQNFVVAPGSQQRQIVFTVDDGQAVNHQSNSVTSTVNAFTISHAPIGTSTTISSSEITAYTFSTSDFGFSDPNDSPANLFTGIVIGKPPTDGVFADNGAPVGPNQFISIAEISAGLLVYTPETGSVQNVSDQFSFQVQDDGSTENGGQNLDPVPKTITIDLQNPNQAPSGTSAKFTTIEDTSFTLGTASFGFTDPNDKPANNFLNVEITTAPTVGKLWDGSQVIKSGQFIPAIDIANGIVVYSPASHTFGSNYDSFTFQVQDDGGTAFGGVDLDPAPKTIAFDVSYVDHAPVGTSTAITAIAGAPYPFTVANFGFKDPNNIPANALKAVDITTLPSDGTIIDKGKAVIAGQFIPVADISGGKLQYLPGTNTLAANYDSFTFQVQDNGSLINAGTNLDPAPKAITINTGYKLVFAPALPTSGTAGVPFPVVVQIEDAKNQIVTNDNSTVSLTIGSQTYQATASLGIATFSADSFVPIATTKSGKYTIVATDGSDLKASTSITIAAAAPYQLSFTSNPSASSNISVVAGATIGLVKIYVLDQFGNLESSLNSSTVTLSINSGPGTFAAGTLTRNVVNGIATFNDLVLDTAGTYQFTATNSAFTSNPSPTSNVKVSAAAPTLLAMIAPIPVEGPVTAVAGSTFQFSQYDRFGNPVSSMVTLTIVGDGTFANGTTTAKANASAGIATFKTLFSIAGTYTLNVSNGSAIQTYQVTIIPAAAKKLVFVEVPPAFANFFSSIGSTVSVAVEDTYGNIVSSNSSSVTLSVSTLKSSATVTNGVATIDISNFVIRKVGSYIWTATDGSLTKATANLTIETGSG